jgi:hypothetical protein
MNRHVFQSRIMRRWTLLYTIVITLGFSPYGVNACFAHGGGGGGGHGGGHGGHGGHSYGLFIVPGPTVERVIIVHRAKCDALNVQVTVPSDAWKRVDPRDIGSHTSFMLTRHNPDITISLAGERVGVEADETSRTLLTASQEKMKALPAAVVLPGERQVAGQNIQGVSYHATAEQDGKTAHYAIWVASHNGYNYKLAVYGEKKYAPAVDSAMYNFVHGMKQLDTKRVAHLEKKIDATRRIGVKQIEFEYEGDTEGESGSDSRE